MFCKASQFLINSSFREGIFPVNLKRLDSGVRHVVPIYKTDDMYYFIRNLCNFYQYVYFDYEINKLINNNYWANSVLSF